MKKFVYISGYDLQVTHIFLFFGISHHQRERAQRKLKNSLRELVNLEGRHTTLENKLALWIQVYFRIIRY